ncbi:MAG: excinuclease ABC subunit UvrC [Deltaproteobacteria bacterium]|nr:excinuclease ABC subunit UvrC [Deltaproteobacteria bacterium]
MSSNPTAAPEKVPPLAAIKNQIRTLPRQPGVYLMKDGSGKVIYVGKAKDLKKRVASYLKVQDIKTARLMERAAALEFILTENEKEALILESSLIKKHRPRYNVDLRDDKRYPCLRLDPEEAFPRIQVVRRIKNDGALYLGPFSAAAKMRATLALIQRIFPLRQCRQQELPRRSRPCLYHQTGRCPAPCQGKISREAYRERVREIHQFFQGKNKELLLELKRKMRQAAEDLNFEEAATQRDRIRAVSETLQEQHVVSTRLIQADAVALVESGEGAAAAILFIRFGSVTGMARFRFRNPSQTLEEILSDLLAQYYQPDRFMPPLVFIPWDFLDRRLVAEVLADRRGGPVEIRVPARGEGRHWLELAEENARSLLAEKDGAPQFMEQIAGPLQEKLGLRRIPERVGCLDISNLQGAQAVGSWVVFQQGDPEKSRYRRFRIRTVDQPDDYAMMAEVISRLIRHPEEIPDLVLIDGGKGQLNVLREIFRRVPEEQRPDLAAIAKKTFIPAGGKDGLYLPGRKNPVNLKTDSPLLHFLQRVRDEAHRFALSYHHLLRKKEIVNAGGKE